MVGDQSLSGSSGCKTGPHPGQDTPPPEGHSHARPCSLSLGQFHTPAHPMCASLGCGQTPESPKKTHTGPGRTCTLHADSGPGWEFTFLLIRVIEMLNKMTLLEDLLTWPGSQQSGQNNISTCVISRFFSRVLIFVSYESLSALAGLRGRACSRCGRSPRGGGSLCSGLRSPISSAELSV